MGKLILGIELGSTRIKSVLVNERAEVLAKGCYDWENILVDNLWSYKLEDAVKGLQISYCELVKNYGKDITKLDAIGISAMMHGYLAFDKNDKLLAPFRTWRNTNTKSASEELSNLFKFNVPMRWSVSQYYQSVLDNLEHVKNVAHLTTLSGYIHYLLSGKRVLGVGDASGMFPIDNKKRYDKTMLEKFNQVLLQHGIKGDFKDKLPQIALAGENAGNLTKEGALLIDPTGKLKEGCILCPPEGDMGTGMVCTNCVTPKTASASLGTSGNFMVVLNKNLKKYYPEIDIITTPTGDPVALIHTSTCTSVIDMWINTFDEVLKLFDTNVSKKDLYEKLLKKSFESDENLGGIVAYNYLAGEPIAKTYNGAPMVFTNEDGNFGIANFVKAQIYSAIATLSLGMDILKEEKVDIKEVFAHGGILKTKGIIEPCLSALFNAPITTMSESGEGGAFGIAVLALYMLNNGIKLSVFLENIFNDVEKQSVTADEIEKKKFDKFIKKYKQALRAERILCELK